MPEVPPELVHLVDSAIVGLADGLDRLRVFVSATDDEEDVRFVSRSVVDLLLSTMGGVDSLDEVGGGDSGHADDDGTGSPPSVISNPRAAVVAAELVPWLPWTGDASPRTRMVRGLLMVLKACTRNRAMCSAAGLLPVLLQAAEKVFVDGEGGGWDGTQLCECIEVLGGHSAGVSDLHFWLSLIKKLLVTSWAKPLMLALEKAVGSKEAKGPAVTFEFDGESSGLLGPGESRWPFSNGLGFATWIYIESFSDTLNTATAAAAIAAAAAAKSGKSSPTLAAAAASALLGEGTTHMPRLFSFLSSENQGVEAYFHGQFLVIDTGGGKGRKASLHFTYAFKPKRWYFIGLEHTNKQALVGKVESELRLYVDGSLYESRPFEFPWISKPLAFCCIGTNPPPTIAGLQRRRRQCPLFAEMGPVYIFKEPIGAERMAKLFSRGGDALPSFGGGAGLPWKATNDHVRSSAEESSLLNAEIGECLHLLYHPSLLRGRFCPDGSPSGAAGTHRRHAEVLGLVHVSLRLRVAESLWALAYGGPMALLPLTVSNVHGERLEPMLGNFPLSLATVSLAPSTFRTISSAILHHGNNEELRQTYAPELLSLVLTHLLRTLPLVSIQAQDMINEEEIVAAIVSLCQSPNKDHGLKVQLFSTLLLDLKIWCSCSYGLQKKLLSSLSDMALAESKSMRDANALQMLLDGCRRCYWVIRETDSLDMFPLKDEKRPIGEVNALVDELLVAIELLIVSAPPTFAVDDVRCLIGSVVCSPQTNQVARILHLIYRLIVQPNVSRANTFAQAFISSGGIESLIILLHREARIGDGYFSDDYGNNQNQGLSKIDDGNVLDDSNENKGQGLANIGDGDALDNSVEHESQEPPKADFDPKACGREAEGDNNPIPFDEQKGPVSQEDDKEDKPSCANVTSMASVDSKIGKSSHSGGQQFSKNLGGISFSLSFEHARNNVYNIDNADGVVVGAIHILGALVKSGHLKLSSGIAGSRVQSSTSTGGISEDASSTFDDKVSMLLFALHKAFEAAPKRLMTTNVCMALVSAAINASADDNLHLYDSGHRFEHIQLLAVLLHSLPYGLRAFQACTIRDILFLACSHPENRIALTSMAEWPEWILEVLIYNHEVGEDNFNDKNFIEIEDLIHSFLNIVLEHSIRQKDGWKDVEATIHCAEWLCMVGGSSTGDQRLRREEALPKFKRRLLSSLLEFSARELRVEQTELIAAAAAGVAAGGLSPEEAKLEAENATQLSFAMAENAVVVLMLVEDHLRTQGQQFCASRCQGAESLVPSADGLSNLLSRSVSDAVMTGGSKQSSPSSDAGSLPLDVLASMADENGQVSASTMERLTAAVAAEPYESVRHAFLSYGSCVTDLAEGWKYRSRLWYGVGVPSKSTAFGGGGSGWDSWKSVLERDSGGDWIELPLLKSSISMLQALLLDDSGLGGGLGIGGGSGTGMGVMAALYQLLDSDQPFLCMLRLSLLSLREDDNGEDDISMKNVSIKDVISEGMGHTTGSLTRHDGGSRASARRTRSGLLWSVLAPLLNMPITESKRQRVLVTSSIIYSEVWHAVNRDRKPLRKQYIESIIPPFVAILRRWRPLLASIHELATSDGQNPLIFDDRALAADAVPLETALLMISPGWAAAFASPPAAMALAIIAAGASGTETMTHSRSTLSRHDTFLLERKSARLQTFSSFQKLSDTSTKPLSSPKDKAAAKAAALAAARDLERNSKIGSGRGLSAVAMATSAQRRSAADAERAKRWNVSEAMGSAWTECVQSDDMKVVPGTDLSPLSYKYLAVLVSVFAFSRNTQKVEMDRRVHVGIVDRLRGSAGTRAWRSLLHCLVDMDRLYGSCAEFLCAPDRVFWKLDFTESSSRIRRFLKRDYKGTDHLGAAADYENRKLLGGDGTIPSTDSIILSEAMPMEDKIEENDQTGTENILKSADDKPRNSSSDDQTSKSAADLRSSYVSTEHNLVQSTVVTPGYAPADADERVIIELPSLWVRPLKVLHGTFQITARKINFLCNDYTSETSSEDQVSTGDQQDQSRSWLISSLHQIFSRRYLLRRSALELFMVDRSNIFFDFENIDSRKKAYRAIIQAQPPYLNDIFLATQRPEQILKRTQLMERWARWELSNFEYLMELNTLAGRSYNDITQYPVFPWIIADYDSNTLNLENPSSYRDLSKPVGALNPERLKKFQERYSSFEDPTIPKFHYGSHYSSAGTVLYYLMRVEPFTTLSIQLQGGKFDHADRMFSDLGATWNGVLHEMSDVKELVPEMFYLPEMFTNVNSVDFGTTQQGEKLGYVHLPPWAENPVDFILKHRKALESEHVSAHLHEWIDLIFGYKQRGKEAVLANNVFFYITYEGMVDIDKITDPVQRQATQDQIAYFGQTPSQLLSVPHMKKRPLADVLHLQTIFRNPRQIKPYIVQNSARCNVPAGAMLASNDAIVIVDENAPAPHVALHKWQPNTPNGQGTPFLFSHGKTVSNSTGSAIMRLFKGPGDSDEDYQFPQAIAFAASGIQSTAIVAITYDKEIITGGHADNTVKLISPDGAKTIESASGHMAPVTCLALSSNSNYLVTGSRDTTVILWRIHRAASPSGKNFAEPSAGASTARGSPIMGNDSARSSFDAGQRHRIEGPMHVLRGHLGEVVCCAVSPELGLIASSSSASGVLLHSLRKGRFMRKLDIKEAHEVSLSPHGIILIWNKTDKRLSSFTVNGLPIATISPSPFTGQVSCIEVSTDGQYALIGTCSSYDVTETVTEDQELQSHGLDGGGDMSQINETIVFVPVPSLSFVDLHALRIFYTLVLEKDQDITAIALTRDNTNLLVSTADKQLIVYTDPALSLKVVDHMLRLGWESDGLLRS